MGMKLILPSLVAALLLSGCAGTDQNDMTSPEAPVAFGPGDWLVAVDAARDRIPGSAPFSMTSDELSALDEEISSNADTLLMGGFYRTGTEFPGDVRLTDCSEGVCRFGTNGERSLDDTFFGLEYTPVMEHKGIRLAQARLRGSDAEDPRDFSGYGGWMQYNSFAVSVTFLPAIGSDPDEVRALNYSVGTSSGTNPVSGAATWAGVAVGVDLNQMPSKPDMLQGDAEVVYDFDDRSLGVTLDNFVNLTTGARLGRTMEWSDLGVTDGAFSQGGRFDGEYIHGSYYGAYHEEVGGVYKSGSIAGSFGASRSDRQ